MTIKKEKKLVPVNPITKMCQSPHTTKSNPKLLQVMITLQCPRKNVAPHLSRLQGQLPLKSNPTMRTSPWRPHLRRLTTKVTISASRWRRHLKKRLLKKQRNLNSIRLLSTGQERHQPAHLHPHLPLHHPHRHPNPPPQNHRHQSHHSHRLFHQLRKFRCFPWPFVFNFECNMTFTLTRCNPSWSDCHDIAFNL